MLDKEGKNIDACTIGIPDFMHATVALACMQHGKHVYLEKPLTRTPWEARLLQDAAVKYKVATQMGNQGFSHECNRVAAEIVWSGAIGDVTEAHISTSPGTHPTGLQQPPPEGAVPSDAGLGPVAGGRVDASVQRRLRALQLARLSGFRHRADRQLGHPHGRAGAYGAAARRAHQRGMRRRDGQAATSPIPTAAWCGWSFPARGDMPAVTVYYHDSRALHRPGCLPRAGHGERDHPAAGQ